MPELKWRDATVGAQVLHEAEVGGAYLTVRKPVGGDEWVLDFSLESVLLEVRSRAPGPAQAEALRVAVEKVHRLATALDALVVLGVVLCSDTPHDFGLPSRPKEVRACRRCPALRVSFLQGSHQVDVSCTRTRPPDGACEWGCTIAAICPRKAK